MTILQERTPEAAGHTAPAETRPRPQAAEIRRSTRTSTPADRLAAVGAAAAAIAVTALLFTQIAPFDGVLGFVVVAWVLFIGLYALLVSLADDGPAVRDRVAAAAVVHSLGFLILLALLVVVGFTLWRGRDALGHLNFYLEDLSVSYDAPLTSGGILHGIVGTLQMMAISLLIAVPLGTVCAVFLAEMPGPFSRFVRTVVEAMTALPSIVAGLFIYATAIVALGLPFSGFAAALAITIMMLPIMIRAADVVLRLVPGTLREAALALGAGQWRTVWHVVLPTARSGLMTSVLLATARGIGETSPVLLTAGFTSTLNLNPFADPQVSLPLLTFVLVRAPDADQIARGFGAGATLLILVLLLFAIARRVGGRGPGDLSDGQRRRRAQASWADQRRMQRRAASRAAGTARP